MATAVWLLCVTGSYPLWRAWRGNRRTSLAHAVGWAAAAWTAWCGTLLLGATADPGTDPTPGRYLALCLTGCAGVAVLGARRPGVGAWNLVVGGLLAVMLLPLAESLIADKQPLDGLRTAFLATTLAVGVLHYLPTRLAPA